MQAALAVPRARLLDLMKVQCRIFSHTFNPTGVRTGNKVLRQRLKGPQVQAYYPKEVISMKSFMNSFPHLEMIDEVEQRRLDKVDRRKSRGKGAPKKKRTAAEGKKGKRR